MSSPDLYYFMLGWWLCWCFVCCVFLGFVLCFVFFVILVVGVFLLGVFVMAVWDGFDRFWMGLMVG